MPCNIINLSDITCHWEWPPLKSCPLPEDFVTYNGLWPARLTWFAPHWRTLSRTMDFNPLGQHDFAPHQRTLSCTMDFDPLGRHDLPLIGGLCLIQRTLTRWVSMITQQDIASTNKPMTHCEWHQEQRKMSIQRPTTTGSPRIRSPQSKMRLI